MFFLKKNKNWTDFVSCARAGLVGNIGKFPEKSAKSSKNSRTLQFIGEFSVCIADFFSDFSENFPIFPTSPARAQVTKSDHDLQAKVVFFSLAQKSWI